MLYHYTDFAAFDGIIRCAELRLNNTLNMNDTSETRLFMNGICSAVIERLSADGDMEMVRNISDFFKNELAEEFHYSAYAACFSKYRDDAAQWERYGHLGQGVCIGFKKELLQKMVNGNLSLRDVYYRDDLHDHPLVDQFYWLIRDTQAFTENFSGLQELMNEAWIQSAAFKHPSFASERESRLVVTPFKGDLTIKPQYHVSKGRIKKYYPLDLNKMCGRIGLKLEDIVDEIIIGPTSTQSVPILQDYLEDNSLASLGAKITLSSCPLRQPST